MINSLCDVNSPGYPNILTVLNCQCTHILLLFFRFPPLFFPLMCSQVLFIVSPSDQSLIDLINSCSGVFQTLFLSFRTRSVLLH